MIVIRPLLSGHIFVVHGCGSWIFYQGLLIRSCIFYVEAVLLTGLALFLCRFSVNTGVISDRSEKREYAGSVTFRFRSHHTSFSTQISSDSNLSQAVSAVFW